MRMSEKNGKRVIYVNVRKLILISVTVILCLLMLVSVFFLIRRFLKVGTFEVKGVSVYANEEIVGASGIKRGDLLYSIDLSDVEKNILEECPYLESVDVRRVFPNKVKIETVGKMAHWYIELSGSKYALDGNLTVIAETGRTEGITKLILPDVKEVMVGSVPKFGESETEVKKTLEIIAAIRESSLKKRMTEADLESRWDISIVVDGTFNIYLHDMSDLEAKMLAVESVLSSEKLKDCIGAEIDASDPANVGVIPVYDKSASGENKK